MDDAGPIKSTLELYEEVLNAVPLGIYGTDIKVVVCSLGGAGGPGGADAKVLKC